MAFRRQPLQLPRLIPSQTQNLQHAPVRSLSTTTRTCRNSKNIQQVDSKRVQSRISVVEDAQVYLQLRENLKPDTAFVLLEEILEKHQHRLAKADTSPDNIKAIFALGNMYLQDLYKSKRLVAGTQFSRNLANAFRERVKLGERFAKCRLVLVLETFYLGLRELGGNSRERWKVISEAKMLIEALTPNDWDPDAPRPLRVQRSQILQFYTAEEDQRRSEPSNRKDVIPRLIASHREILQLEDGLPGNRAGFVQLKSLRAICDLSNEERQDHRKYALMHRKVADRVYQAAVEDGTLGPLLAHERLASFILLCRSYMVAEQWEDVARVASDGLGVALQMTWPDSLGSFVEACQLYAYRSQAYLKTHNPRDALIDAKYAVEMAQSIPWGDEHPHSEVNAEYPQFYEKNRWQHYAQINLIDVLYDERVQCPEEQFGLRVAVQGLELVNPTDLGQLGYAIQYRSKKTRALRRLGKWQEALVECRALLTLLNQSLFKQTTGILEDIVEVCEDGAECVEMMGHKATAEKLFRATDDFASLLMNETTQADRIAKAQALEAMFEDCLQEYSSTPLSIESADTHHAITKRLWEDPK
ncbi:hypothetical protein CPB86DRAFT_752294 [Serendipita vermifera]|nr:hypothetical protein CPB86DRAFT_752294 [Serendipita vermifera]